MKPQRIAPSPKPFLMPRDGDPTSTDLIDIYVWVHNGVLGINGPKLDYCAPV